ncbi:MAG: hypothetical protein MJ070_05565 [Lachnospiraceae bacterium]|nr:hypothetical protein [Lachnospiraceae bacterium]
MRAVLISAVLLLLSLTVGISCSAFACSILRETGKAVAALPEDRLPALSEVDPILSEWEKKSAFLAVTVNYVWLSQAENAMTALRSVCLAETGESLPRYLAAREAALSALKALEKAEGVTLHSFF